MGDVCQYTTKFEVFMSNKSLDCIIYEFLHIVSFTTSLESKLQFEKHDVCDVYIFFCLMYMYLSMNIVVFDKMIMDKEVLLSNI